MSVVLVTRIEVERVECSTSISVDMSVPDGCYPLRLRDGRLCLEQDDEVGAVA